MYKIENDDNYRLCGALTTKGDHCKYRLKTGQKRCHLHKTIKSHSRSTGTSDNENREFLRKTDLEAMAVVNDTDGNDKFKLFSETLRLAGFWKKIESERKIDKTAKKLFRIVIKPNLEIFDTDAPTGTDPEIVEHLVFLLHKKGYMNVVVADGLGSADLWLENRDVPILADLVGYHYKTEDGKPYDIINLSEDLIKVNFPKEGTLRGTELAKSWINAQFRINIAKNKTDDEGVFSLCLQNLIGVLPLRDKEYHYYHRLKPGDVCVDLLKQTPVHFSIVDAFVSNHGSDGTHASNPLLTKTYIASDDLLLADWVAALKMGADPYASSLSATALRTIGLPSKYKIKGNLAPYEGWINTHPALSDSVRKRNQSFIANRKASNWFQSVNRELFPFKNEIDDKINLFISKYLSNTDNHFNKLLVKVLCNFLFANFYNIVESWRILFDKDKLRQKQTALGFDLKKYSVSDYESLVDYMQPLAQIAGQTPPDVNGLRWRYIDNSVLFEFSRHIPVKYDKFISRVKISNAVNMMNDYIGGACVPVLIDKQGRITHQAERNIYLPQPNWMAAFGATVIDVCKIELIHYKNDYHRIFWRTVSSLNNSASFDDGIVTFARDGNNGTKITIVARQKFKLPLVWEIINLDKIPEIKDFLVSNSYITFFSRTIANFEAAYEERSTITGLPWQADYGEVGAVVNNTPQINIVEIFEKSGSLLESLLNNKKDDQRDAFVDEDGFSHFAGNDNDNQSENDNISSKISSTNTVQSFFSDLFSAVKRDLGVINNSTKDG